MDRLGPAHVQEVLDSRSPGIRVIHYDDHTSTSVDAARVIFGYAPGGVPPVGHRTSGIPIILDETLSRWERLYAAAGTPHDNVEVTFDELCTITGGTVLDCVKDASIG